MNATLELRSWLRRRLRVETLEGVFVVEYSGRGFGYESVWIDGVRAPGSNTGAWFVPRFDFDLGSAYAAVEVRVWPWLTIRSFHLVVAGEVLYEEGPRCARRAEQSTDLLRRAARRMLLPVESVFKERPDGQRLRILFESVGWDSNVPTQQVIDLAQLGDFTFLFMMFGAGNYIEARVVGESAEAVEAFCALMRRGGYERSSRPSAQSQLYRPGDEAYPEPEAFVYVCPKPDPHVVDTAWKWT